jgi:hypothetical protein
MDNMKEDRSIILFIILDVLWAVVNLAIGMFVPSIVKYSIIAFDLDYAGNIIVIVLGINLIYVIVYMIILFRFYKSWIEDINVICDGDGQHTEEVGMFILLSIVTLGIYSFFWQYNVQNRLKSNASRYNVMVSDSGSTVLLWNLLGILLWGIGPLIALHIMLTSTNQLVYAYNHGGIMPQPRPMPVPQPLPQPQPFPQPQPVPQPRPMPQPQPMPQVLPFPQPQPVPQSNTMGQVRCIKGMAAGQGFRLPPNRKMVIGKNPGKATLVLNESYISNVHCTIQYNEGNNTYIVTDHSTNGTFINGIRMQKEMPTTCPAGTVLMLVNSNIEIKLG